MPRKCWMKNIFKAVIDRATSVPLPIDFSITLLCYKQDRVVSSDPEQNNGHLSFFLKVNQTTSVRSPYTSFF